MENNVLEPLHSLYSSLSVSDMVCASVRGDSSSELIVTCTDEQTI